MKDNRKQSDRSFAKGKGTKSWGKGRKWGGKAKELKQIKVCYVHVLTSQGL